MEEKDRKIIELQKLHEDGLLLETAQKVNGT